MGSDQVSRHERSGAQGPRVWGLGDQGFGLRGLGTKGVRFGSSTVQRWSFRPKCYRQL